MVTSQDDVARFAELLRQGRAAEVIAELGPRFDELDAMAVNTLGLAHAKRKEMDAAERAFRRAAALDPQLERAHANVGKLLADAGRFIEARSWLEQAVELVPGSTKLRSALGQCLGRLGDHAAAIAAFEGACAIGPADAALWNNLGAAFTQHGQDEEAKVAYRRALREDPSSSVARVNLADALRRGRDFDEALEQFDEAERSSPGSSLTLSRAIGAYEVGDIDGALGILRRILDDRPLEQLKIGSSRLFFGLHSDALSREEIRDAHASFGVKMARAFPEDFVARARRGAGSPLRVAFVSPDFNNHVVMKFFEPLLRAFDRKKVEPILVFDGQRRDETTARLSRTYEWLDVSGLPPEEGTRRARSLDLDVAVDLAAHTSETPLFVMAPRIAPLQMTYLGYPGTTGLASIDVRLTDALADPPGAEIDYVERVHRFTRTAWVYEPGTAPLAPFDETRAPVFGSFNRAAKLSPRTISLWARVLDACPRAKLVLRGIGVPTRAMRLRLDTLLGVDRMRRVEIRPWAASAGAAIAGYSEIDVALDSFPYHGTTTTCDALGMGVPVVSLQGDVPAARVGKSLLDAVGLADLAVDTESEYVRVAALLMNDVPRRRELARTLRSRITQGPLGDASSLAREMEDAFRG